MMVKASGVTWKVIEKKILKEKSMNFIMENMKKIILDNCEF